MCSNEGLVLSGGHALVLAWFLGMHLAMELQDEGWIRRLWECGLTVTVRVRKATPADPRHVILDSVNFSEACQVAKLAGTDSFSVFTQKLQAFTIVLFSYTKLHVVGFNKDTRYNMSSEWLNVLGWMLAVVI